MKRVLLAAAVVAGGLTSAGSAGAVPLGAKTACAVANSSALTPNASCRFVGTGPLGPTGGQAGVGGVTDTGWQITYTARKVKSTGPGGCAAAYENVAMIVRDGGAGQVNAQPTSVAGRVYTLTVFGNGELQGGGGNSSSSPSATEPDDQVVDETGGVPPC